MSGRFKTREEFEANYRAGIAAQLRFIRRMRPLIWIMTVSAYGWVAVQSPLAFVVSVCLAAAMVLAATWSARYRCSEWFEVMTFWESVWYGLRLAFRRELDEPPAKH